MYDILQDLVFYFEVNHQEFVKLVFDTVIFPASVVSSTPTPTPTTSTPTTTTPTTRYSLQHALVELLFADILRLPVLEQKLAYYSVLLNGLCRARPKEVAPVLGKVIYTVFERIDDMDVECQNRFTSWFSHHLSNFDYRWNWAAW